MATGGIYIWNFWGVHDVFITQRMKNYWYDIDMNVDFGETT